VYQSAIGLQIPNGGVQCQLLHVLRISDAQVSAQYGVTTASMSAPYYSGSLIDVGGLEEAMWSVAPAMVALALDEFRRFAGFE
jgi:hypothetical protein